MLPAAKIVFASYLLVNGITDEAKKIIDSNYEKVWDFTKEHFLTKFVKQMIALEKPAKGSVAQVERILDEEDVKNFKPVAVVEIIADWVKKIVKK